MTKLAQTEAIQVAKLAEFEAVKTTKLVEIEAQKNISLTEIENNTQLALENIRRKEDFRIMELRADISTIQKNKRQIADTLKKANQDIDLSWLDSCNRILRIANTLDHNLTYYAHKNLEMSKFHYYTHLHFRAMIAADFVHREYKKIDQSFTEINRFIVRMKPTPTFYGDYKNFIHSKKNQIKSIRNLSLNRLHSMNHQTEILRDKIGKECGKRGYEWWLERKKHDK